MGRPKGAPNRMTREMREVVREAFEKAGGVEYLERLARDRPEVFVRLLSKLIPQAHQLELDVASVIKVVDLTGGDARPERQPAIEATTTRASDAKARPPGFYQPSVAQPPPEAPQPEPEQQHPERQADPDTYRRDPDGRPIYIQRDWEDDGDGGPIQTSALD